MNSEVLGCLKLMTNDTNQIKHFARSRVHKCGAPVHVGYNDAGRNDNLDIKTENAGTGFAALETQWL